MQIQQFEKLDKKRVRVLLEDGNSFVLYYGEKKRYELEEGMELSEEIFQEITSEVLVPRARKRVMHLLERMDRTESQLRAKLKQGYYPEDVIDHYLDDLRFAQNYVRNHKEQKSQRIIEVELLRRGVAKDFVQQALEEEYCEENERDLILKWTQKKQYSSETADLKEKQKMYQFLLRKGFHWNDILYVLERV